MQPSASNEKNTLPKTNLALASPHHLAYHYAATPQPKYVAFYRAFRNLFTLTHTIVLKSCTELLKTRHVLAISQGIVLAPRFAIFRTHTRFTRFRARLVRDFIQGFDRVSHKHLYLPYRTIRVNPETRYDLLPAIFAANMCQ